MDVRANWYPTRHIDPNEPGLVAGYTFADNELAQFGRYINRANTGAGFDLTTRVGTPLVGQGGGVYVPNDANSYWQGLTYVGGSRIRADLVVTDTPTATRPVFQNGNMYLIYLSASNQPYISLNGAVTYTGYLVNMSGRGPFVVDGWLTPGLMQRIYVNGTYRNEGGPVLAGVTANFMQVGRHAEVLRGEVYDPAPVTTTDALIRSQYVRDFARKVLWQWTPRDVGEGPVGGILTGSYSGVGGWTCPLGAATMGFVWRNDLSDPAGGRLTLTDTQKVNLNRIDFEYGSRPWFNSWLVEYEVRDPATDDMIIGWTPRRGVDPTAAGSQSYYMRCWTAAGPWWRVGLFYENGAQIDGADAPFPGPVAGDRCKALITRDVDGSIQTWNYVPSPQRGWWWTTAVGNNVATLAEGNICIAPRGCYVERVTAFQSSMTPHELEAVLP